MPVKDGKAFRPILFLLAILFLPGTLPQAGAKEVWVVGDFSNTPAENRLPEGWEPLTFKKIERHTQYSLFPDEGRRVIRAVSRASASGLIRRITFDPHSFPILQWRWKITSVFKGGDVRRKEGDDYPARVYINFAYDLQKAGFFESAKYETARLIYGEYPPAGAINYIWASKAPVGTLVDNPYTDRAKMVVVESGDAKLNTWIEVQRNIVEDYRRAFGGDPPMISGIALMTDTDNTGDSTVSFFGDIVLKAVK